MGYMHEGTWHVGDAGRRENPSGVVPVGPHIDYLGPHARHSSGQE
jgi:glutathionyl-hydroquinone reductase